MISLPGPAVTLLVVVLLVVVIAAVVVALMPSRGPGRPDEDAPPKGDLRR